MSSSVDGAPARVALLLVVCTLGLAPALALAGEEPGGETSTTAGEAVNAGAVAESRVVVDGATISWNAAAQRLEAPSAEQAARLAAAFRQILAAKASEPGMRHLASPGELEEVLLPNGMTRVRLSAEHLNFSIVRLDGEGHFERSCADGVEGAVDLLGTTVSGSIEER